MLPSTSVAPIVTVPDELEMVTIPDDCNVNEPPPLDKVFVYDVVPLCPNVCNSFDVLPSISVAAIVIVFPASESAIIPDACNVIAVLPDVLEFINEVVPVPAPTVNDPSFVISKSPVFAITVPVTEIPVPAV